MGRDTARTTGPGRSDDRAGGAAKASRLRGRYRDRCSLDDGEPDLLVPRLAEGDLDLVVVYRYDLGPQVWPAGWGLMALEVWDLTPRRHVEVLTLAGRPGPAVGGMISSLRSAVGAVPDVER